MAEQNLLDRLVRYITPISPEARARRADKDNDKEVRVGSEMFKRMFPAGLYERMYSTIMGIKMKTLENAFAQAEGGELSGLISLYMRIEHSDARLKGMIASRRNAASRASYTITVDEKNPLAVEAKEFVIKNIEDLKWNMLQRDIMDGRMYGVALYEKIWRKGRDGNLWLDKIKQIDHSLYHQFNDVVGSNANDKFGKLYLRGPNLVDRTFVNEINPFKILSAVNSDRDGYHDLSGIMRPVARWYIVKTFAAASWVQFAETYGFPLPTVTMPKEEFHKNKELVKTLLQSVGVNRYGIFFPGMEYEIHESAKVTSIEVFERLISTANTEMAIALLGQNLSSEVQGGSYAAAESHMDVLDNLITDDLEWQDEIINDQVVYDMVRLNFPTLDIEDYPRYSSEIKQEVDLQKLGTGIKTMSGLVPISTQWVYEKAQIPQPNDGEETIGGFRENMIDIIDQNTN